MILHLKMGKVRSISIEWNKEFGIWPLYNKTSYRCETIVDVPYTQILFTSGKWTPLRRAANDHEKTKKASKHSKRADRDRS